MYKFKNKKITVMGLGRFGGGEGVARFLAENGAIVTVTDLKSEKELSEPVSRLKGLGINFVLGHHNITDFVETDMVVVNPAVPRESEFLLEAQNRHVTLQTEIGLFVSLCPAQTWGVTGSNGKTTTVSMIKSILEQSSLSFYVGGNIGGSLLQSLNSINKTDIVLLELSSFQLEWLGDMKWSPNIATILNITPNHLDRHKTYKEYRLAKSSILSYQKANGYNVVLNRDDPGAASMFEFIRSNLLWVSSNPEIHGLVLENGLFVKKSTKKSLEVFKVSGLQVPGKHNVMNALCAAATALQGGLTSEAITRGLETFKGVPHRIEYIGENAGIKFYNDSKSTTPEASVTAVNSFEKGVIPILGGYDKGVSFDDMALKIAGKVKWAALIGKTAPIIAKSLENAEVQFTVFGTLEDALKGCILKAVRGDTVILTPGCASYDMFTDYENRGEIFKEIVKDTIRKGF